MPENKDRKFELILGKGQLLSVLFILMALSSVLFTIGYIVGRNRSAIVTADSELKTQLPRPMMAVDPSEPPSGYVEGLSELFQSAHAPASAPGLTAQRFDSTAGVAAGSIYLQVAAVAKTEAQVLVELLGKKGFHAVCTTAPIPKTYRVLVGPLQEGAIVAQARADLNKAGFKGFDAIVRKH